jgi:hypothetical protein
MIEMAIAYVGAYLGRKMLDQVSSDVDTALDNKLKQLYQWVKAKLTGRPSGEVSLSLLEEAPEGQKQQVLVADQLAQAVGDDEAATNELQMLIAELDRLRPPGISIQGLARAEDVHGKQVGVKVEGALPEGSTIIGEAAAKTVHKDGENTGAYLRNLP